ncbi:MAG TPA: glutamine amidotransferase, partial [Nitrosopumilaceae archaeon]|nr:glutamine amidotransferase [Nitrosopumilaceae archaeon]
DQEINILKQNLLCSGTMKVFESHNYEISRISNSLINLADSKNCQYEMIQLNNHNIFGTQFHPEMSSDGQTIIEAFVSL